MPKIAELVVDPRFGLLLRTLRRGASLSLRGLATRTSYSRSFLWDLEAGRRHPSLETARRLDGSLSADGALIALVSARRSPERVRSTQVSAECVRTTPVSAEYVRTTPSADTARPATVPAADDGEPGRPLPTPTGHPAVDDAVRY